MPSRAEYTWNDVVFYECKTTLEKIRIRICAARVDMRKGFNWSKFIYDGIVLDDVYERIRLPDGKVSACLIRGEKISDIEESMLLPLDNLPL